MRLKFWIKRKRSVRDFVAIDFETANGCRSSVCSVGLVVVRNNEIYDRYYSLIRPRPNYYTTWTTEIHGLTRADTDEAPLFPEVWKEMTERIGDLPLVAHNRPFDEGCLRAVLRLYGLKYPGNEFYCTLAGARRRLRGLPNYRLNTVAKYCGYDLEHHHHALADAEAASIVCLHICKAFGDEAIFKN